MEKQPNSRMCFVCGVDPPRGAIGLRLHFYTDDEGAASPASLCLTGKGRPARPEHQGFPWQLHGGIIPTLLDVPTQISLLA